MKKTGFREILWMTVEERGSNYLQLAPPSPDPVCDSSGYLAGDVVGELLDWDFEQFTSQTEPLFELCFQAFFFVGRKIRANIAFCELNLMHPS